MGPCQKRKEERRPPRRRRRRLAGTPWPNSFKCCPKRLAHGFRLFVQKVKKWSPEFAVCFQFPVTQLKIGAFFLAILVNQANRFTTGKKLLKISNFNRFSMVLKYLELLVMKGFTYFDKKKLNR